MSQNSPKQWFSLEERFFGEIDQKLIENLRKETATAESAEAIMHTTGITDEKLALAIAAMEINVDTLAAFRLVPLVAVAWADDRVEENERLQIKQAAEKAGIGDENPAMHILSEWITRRPTAELFDTWCEYAKSLATSLDEEHRKTLKAEILRQVRAVAEASGGVLGFGSVSQSEKDIIARVDQSLS